jgi:hypothetical protein
MNMTCKCGETFPVDDMQARVDHVLCVFLEALDAPELQLDEPFAVDTATMKLLEAESPSDPDVQPKFNEKVI